MWFDKLIEDILIAEYDGQEFIPYLGNKSVSATFKTYAECKDYITQNQEELIGFEPAIGWSKGLGDYRTNFNSLMRVVDKILQENKSQDDPYGFRSFGVLPDGSYIVRLESTPLATGTTLIDTLFEEVIKYLKQLKY